MTPYDQVPYPCNAYAQTHPGHLAVIARLHGMTPAAPEKCRVLEIGCGDGGNLLPLAYVLPGSHFLGIDLATSSIEAGQKHARDFGLTNIDFRALDLMELSRADLGEWDYIIAHGVFSWVPEAVRLRLLDLCREVLAPQGVAFISYNAHPGSHVRQMFWDMLRYNTENAPDPATKIAQGRALLQFLAQSHGADDDFGTLLRSEAERVLKYNPHHFFHDDLAELNQPYYLHQFADLATARGLQYLGDADYASMHALRYPREVREVLAGIGEDVVRGEQYLDFIKCRRFRQTLLCHQEVEVTRTIPPQVLHEFHYASSVKPTLAVTQAQLLDQSPVDFQGEGSLSLQTSHPTAKVTLAVLGGQWPGRLAFPELKQAVTEGLDTPLDSEAFETMLREFIQMGTAEVHATPAPFTTQLSERPQASAWALYQIRFGVCVTSLLHRTLPIRDQFGRWLLGQLNGAKSPEEIAQAMAATVKPGADGTVDHEKELAEARALVNTGLLHMADLGLLLPQGQR